MTNGGVEWYTRTNKSGVGSRRLKDKKASSIIFVKWALGNFKFHMLCINNFEDVSSELKFLLNTSNMYLTRPPCIVSILLNVGSCHVMSRNGKRGFHKKHLGTIYIIINLMSGYESELMFG